MSRKIQALADRLLNQLVPKITAHADIGVLTCVNHCCNYPRCNIIDRCCWDEIGVPAGCTGCRHE